MPEAQRKAMFQEYKSVLGEVEAYNKANAAQQAVKERAAEAAEKVISLSFVAWDSSQGLRVRFAGHVAAVASG